MTAPIGSPEYHDNHPTRLSSEEIREIARELATYQNHGCRFPGVAPEELHAMMRFYKHVDNLMVESGSTIRKTLIVFGVGGLVSLLVLGLYSKIRTELGI